MIGKTISHYKILGKLGEGGMGVVYQAEDLTLKRDVALKFLPVHAIDDADQRARLMREAQAAAALEHININTVYEIDEVDGQTFIAMAYISGQTLKEKIKDGPLPVETALSLGIQIAAGLNRAHKQGIVHRDIKPANVLVTDEGIVKIVDFGLAKLAGATGLTKTDSTIGTAAYMSPEQALGQVVDHRTDMWSLGVILYEMLAGRRPFRGEHEAMIMYSILNEDYDPLRTERPDVPQTLEGIITKALSKKPSDRYENMAEMLLELRQLLGETPADVTGPLSAKSRTEAPPRPTRRQPMLIAGAAVVALVAIVSAFMLFRSPVSEVGGSETKTGEGQEWSIDSAASVSPELMRSKSASALAADSTGAESTADSLGIPTLAVLYLEDLSGNQSEEYYAAGLTEEMIGDLACLSGLRVLQADEVMSYRDRSAGILKIGAALNADFLMNASVRRGRGELHMDAQLVKVDDGALVWNQRFDRAPEDIFAVRAEAISAMAAAMNVDLLPPERERLLRVPTRDMDAYDLYLQARMGASRHTKKDNDDAEKDLRKALKRDPDFVPPMIALASVCLERIEQDWDFDPKWLTEANGLLDKARVTDPASAEINRTFTEMCWLSGEYAKSLETAHRLVEIRPHDPTSHYLYGVSSYLNAQPANARRELDSALALKPDFAEVYLWLNRIAHESGRTTEASRHLAKALELGSETAEVQAHAGMYSLLIGKFDESVRYFETANRPQPPTPSLIGQLGMAKLFSGKTGEAITLLKEAADKSSWPQFQWYLGWAYRTQGDEKTAKRAFEKCLDADKLVQAINPKSLESAYRMVWVKYQLGILDQVQPELDRLETLFLSSTNQSGKSYWLAGIYAASGNTDRAIELLRQVNKRNYYSSAFMAADPSLTPLRNNSEFRKLVGLEDRS